MSKFHLQITKLYCFTIFESLSLAGASWVALLAARGYSIAQIGIFEAIFHAVSFCGELPSGVIADVLGRKRTLIASRAMALFSAVVMILSHSFGMIAIAMGISALSYNLASGTREALGYDSLKRLGRESEYVRFSSNEMMIYRVFSSVSTLLAGAALYLGYKKAYCVDAVIAVAGMLFAICLTDISFYRDMEKTPLTDQFKDCIVTSFRFLVQNPKALLIIAVNSLIGAAATLMLFFLQAKLPEIGLPEVLLGPVLFLMGMGAALGAKTVPHFSRLSYRKILGISVLGLLIAAGTLFWRNPYFIAAGGFIAAFSDDFLEIRTDIVLNDMIPSEQRATLISVCSFAFSIVMIVLSPLMGMIFDLL